VNLRQCLRARALCKTGPHYPISTTTSTHFATAASRGSAKPQTAATTGETTKRLVEACNSAAKSTLPRVCKNTHVKSTDLAVMSTRSNQMGCW
jgi:hypothetical protein